MKDFFENNKDIGIFILRIGIGIAYIVYGLPKMEGGPEFWAMIGASMSNIGINFAPVFWGFMAALTEFGGGILLMLGLFTRTASAFMAFVMLVAAIHHLSIQDQWYNVISPVKMIAVFIALIFTGAGRYSIDAVISRKKA
jgi:putative oxidoreductase